MEILRRTRNENSPVGDHIDELLGARDGGMFTVNLLPTAEKSVIMRAESFRDWDGARVIAVRQILEIIDANQPMQSTRGIG